MQLNDTALSAGRAQVRRIHQMTAVLLLGLVLASWPLFGWGAALSVLIGGILSGINFHWMIAGIDRLMYGQSTASAFSIIFKFIARLILILVVFFVMIRTSFLSPLAGLVGFSVYLIAGVAEGLRSLRGGK